MWESVCNLSALFLSVILINSLAGDVLRFYITHNPRDFLLSQLGEKTRVDARILKLKERLHATCRGANPRNSKMSRSRERNQEWVVSPAAQWWRFHQRRGKWKYGIYWRYTNVISYKSLHQILRGSLLNAVETKSRRDQRCYELFLTSKALKRFLRVRNYY